MKEIKSLFIESTSKTPQIDMNQITGELILSGKSIPEDAGKFYTDVLQWVNEYIKNPRQTTNLRLNLEYFNTATSIWLAKIVRSLGKIKDHESILIIHLYFHIEEFENMEEDDVKDALSPIIDVIGAANISIGIKIYGTDDNGGILKESMVLI